MSEIVTAASLNRDLLEAGRQLRAAIERAAQKSAEYVRAKHDYQLAWDQAFLRAEGTEQTKKSTANIATVELARVADETLEAKRSAKLEVEAWESVVSAYQTIGATARAEMRMGGVA